jgi:hypothetical protein
MTSATEVAGIRELTVDDIDFVSIAPPPGPPLEAPPGGVVTCGLFSC